MTKKLKAGLVAAAIAALIGIAVSYGFISQETGDEIKTQTDQILNEDDATDQPPATNDTTAQPPASGEAPSQPPVSDDAPAQPPATTEPQTQPNTQPSE